MSSAIALEAEQRDVLRAEERDRDWNRKRDAQREPCGEQQRSGQARGGICADEELLVRGERQPDANGSREDQRRAHGP